LILRQNCKNFIFNKANFAFECGRFGEKFNAVKNKIWQLQPRNQSLKKLLGTASALSSIFQYLYVLTGRGRRGAAVRFFITFAPRANLALTKDFICHAKPG
jgi:hypothetical protein